MCLLQIFLSEFGIRLRARTDDVHFDPPEISAEARTRVPGLAASGAAEAGAAEGGAGEKKGKACASSRFSVPLLLHLPFFSLPSSCPSLRRVSLRNGGSATAPILEREQIATEGTSKGGRSLKNCR